MEWTHGDLMKWTHGDLMKWTHGDLMKWDYKIMHAADQCEVYTFNLNQSNINQTNLCVVNYTQCLPPQVKNHAQNPA